MAFATIDPSTGRTLRTFDAHSQDEVEAKLRLVTSETIADVILAGWRVHAAVASAMQKSGRQPSVNQIVPLRDHSIKVVREHRFVIEVDDVAVMTPAIEVTVALHVYDAVAVVADGHLVAARSGRASADGRLHAAGAEIARRTSTFLLASEIGSLRDAQRC